MSGLAGRLGFGRRGVWAWFGRTGLRVRPCGCIFGLLFRGWRFSGLSLGGSRRVTTVIALLRQRSKSFLEKLLETFALPVPARLTRDFAQPQLGNEPSVGWGEKQKVFLDRGRQIQQNLPASSVMSSLIATRTYTTRNRG